MIVHDQGVIGDNSAQHPPGNPPIGLVCHIRCDVNYDVLMIVTFERAVPFFGDLACSFQRRRACLLPLLNKLLLNLLAVVL